MQKYQCQRVCYFGDLLWRSYINHHPDTADLPRFHPNLTRQNPNCPWCPDVTHCHYNVPVCTSASVQGPVTSPARSTSCTRVASNQTTPAQPNPRCFQLEY